MDLNKSVQALGRFLEDNQSKSKKITSDFYAQKEKNKTLDAEYNKTHNLMTGPVGALLQGKPQELIPRVQQRLQPEEISAYVDYLGRSPETKVSFGVGDMQAVNPGGFVGALAPTAQFAQSATAGAPISTNPSSYMAPKSIEQTIEKLGGWKTPGMRTEFDTAMFNKDVPSILKLLPQIPPEYKARFMEDILKLVNGTAM